MSFFGELKRRNVFKAAILYVVAAWLVLQVVDVLSSLLPVPDWTGSLVFILIVAGFLPVIIVSWVYELTPEGIKRERDVDRSQSIAPQTGRKITVLTVILLVVAIAVVVIDRLVPESTAPVVTEAMKTDEASPTADSSQPAAEKFASPPDRSVAVLPFANHSSREEDAYFVDGIHDDIINQLARIGSLTVISRTSAEKFRHPSQSMREIGAVLGVKTILEGGVQRAGDRIRINVQLIDVDTDAHLWAGTYDRELTTSNVFAIQNEISRSIASALKATLSPEENAQIEIAPTSNMAALEAYFLGRQSMAERTSTSLMEAERQFKKAIALDPDYALAYVALADTYRLQTDYRGLPTSEYQTLSRPLIEKALDIDHRLGEAYIAMAVMQERDSVDVEALFKKGIELAPSYAAGRHWYGLYLVGTGRPAEALVQLEQAARLDPLSAIIRIGMGLPNQSLGRFKEARDNYEAALRIDPDFAVAHNRLGALALFTGHLDQAIMEFRKTEALDPGSPKNRWFLAVTWEMLGARTESDDALAALATVDPSGWYYAYASAILYANRRDLAAARGPAQTVLETVPDVEPMLLIIGLSDLERGRPEDAVARYDRAVPALAQEQDLVVGASNLRDAINLAYLLQSAGETARADRLLERALVVLKTMPRVGLDGYWLGDVKIHAMQGHTERALTALRDAVDDGWLTITGYNRQLLEQFLDGPEYRSIIAEIDAKLAAQLERVREMENEGKLEPLPD